MQIIDAKACLDLAAWFLEGGDWQASQDSLDAYFAASEGDTLDDMVAAVLQEETERMCNEQAAFYTQGVYDAY
jgi:hypothetical protein